MSPGFTFGSGNAYKVKFANSIYPCVDGVSAAVVTTAETTPAVPTGYAPPSPYPASLVNMAASSLLQQRLLFVMNSAGTLYTLPSQQVLASAAAPDHAPVPVGYFVVGDVLIVLASTGLFTFGTTAFNGANVTSTFRDIQWPDSGPSAVSKDTRTAVTQAFVGVQ
ncbi:MAG: hypothetical protein KGL39_06620 [Patescibacteria group bacterium]|nr:hypothetical protein [Patescibacteria group bacterium]